MVARVPDGAQRLLRAAHHPVAAATFVPLWGETMSLKSCRDTYTNRPPECDAERVDERAKKRAERARNSGASTYAAQQIADTLAIIARENQRIGKYVPAPALG
jgi:hypothetical protein